MIIAPLKSYFYFMFGKPLVINCAGSLDIHVTTINVTHQWLLVHAIIIFTVVGFLTLNCMVTSTTQNRVQ